MLPKGKSCPLLVPLNVISALSIRGYAKGCIKLISQEPASMLGENLETGYCRYSLRDEACKRRNYNLPCTSATYKPNFWIEAPVNVKQVSSLVSVVSLVIVICDLSKFFWWWLLHGVVMKKKEENLSMPSIMLKCLFLVIVLFLVWSVILKWKQKR